MQLNPALSFCRVQERDVFLDREGDRYFCLGSELEAAWRAWLAGAASAEDAGRLAARGLLVPGAHQSVAPCCETIAEASLLDVAWPPPSILRIARLAAILAGTRRVLRRRGLSVAAAALGAARRRPVSPVGNHERLAAIAADFERLGLFVSAHNLCLPRSLALGIYLARQGLAPQVVLGVRLRPFRAHCWTECEGLLVNDRFERVRHYKPICRL